MSYEIKELSSVSQELSFLVNPERVDAYLTRACQAINQKAKIAGFRPGKVPRAMLEQHYGQEIQNKALEKLMSEVLFEALDQKGIAPALKPRVQHDKPLLSGQEFAFKALVETLPVVDSVDWENLEVKMPEIPMIGEEAVAEELERLRTRRASFKTIDDRSVTEAGDYVDFAYTEKCNHDHDGHHGAHEHGSRERFIELGKGQFYPEKPEIEQALVGAKVGEPVTIGDMTMTVNIIKECIKPALDDEFAKDVSDDFTTLAELKDNIKTKLEENRAAQVEGTKIEAMLDALIAKNPIEMPQGLVMKQAQEMAMQNASRFPQQFAMQLWQSYGQQMIESAMKPAEKVLKAHLLLQAVAKVEDSEFEFGAMAKLVLDRARLS